MLATKITAFLGYFRVELSEKAAAVERLNTVLEKEQKKFQELEWAVEKERCKPDRKEEHDREKLEVCILLSPR